MIAEVACLAADILADVTDSSRGRKQLTPEAAERVRAKMRELLAAPPYDKRSDGKRARGGNQKLLGDHLGITQPAVSVILAGRGMARHTAEGVARLAGVSVEELLGMTAQQKTKNIDPYPNLTRCLDYHAPDHWPAAAVAAARSGAFLDDVPPTEWVERLDALSAAILNVHKKKAPAARSRRLKP